MIRSTKRQKNRVLGRRRKHTNTLLTPEVSQPSKSIILYREPPRKKNFKEAIMSEIEKIQQYIGKSRIPKKKANAYSIDMREAFAIANMPALEAINLAFKYGQAKGYRAAKAEVRV